MAASGALGAYQAGVFEALHEAGIEPDWVIGTSIGAINAALIAGNAPADRLARLRAFWDRVAHNPVLESWASMTGLSTVLPRWATVTRGVAGFSMPCQKACRRASRSAAGLPAISAALSAPMEVPMTQSGAMPDSCIASYTPAW